MFLDDGYMEMYETDYLSTSDLGDDWFARLRFQPVIDMKSGDILTINILNFNDFNQCEGPDIDITHHYFSQLSSLMRFWNGPTYDCFKCYPLTVRIPPQILSAPGVLKSIQSSILYSGLRPQQLVLMISETSIRDLSDFPVLLESLAELGIRLSIYDCLARDLSVLSFMGNIGVYAFHLPSSVTYAMPCSQISRQYAQGIMALAEKLEQVVVLEGVDNHDLLNYARLAGARYVQGEQVVEPVSVKALCSCCQRIQLDVEKKSLQDLVNQENLE